MDSDVLVRIPSPPALEAQAFVFGCGIHDPVFEFIRLVPIHFGTPPTPISISEDCELSVVLLGGSSVGVGPPVTVRPLETAGSNAHQILELALPEQSSMSSLGVAASLWPKASASRDLFVLMSMCDFGLELTPGLCAASVSPLPDTTVSLDHASIEDTTGTHRRRCVVPRAFKMAMGLPAARVPIRIGGGSMAEECHRALVRDQFVCLTSESSGTGALEASVTFRHGVVEGSVLWTEDDCVFWPGTGGTWFWLLEPAPRLPFQVLGCGASTGLSAPELLLLDFFVNRKGGFPMVVHGPKLPGPFPCDVQVAVEVSLGSQFLGSAVPVNGQDEILFILPPAAGDPQ